MLSDKAARGGRNARESNTANLLSRMNIAMLNECVKIKEYLHSKKAACWLISVSGIPYEFIPESLWSIWLLLIWSLVTSGLSQESWFDHSLWQESP